MLTYNFCANSQLYGYEQDVRTGGQCSYTEDNLPDEHCMFYVNQQTSATASYMALPYLDRYVFLQNMRRCFGKSMKCKIDTKQYK